MKLLDFSIATDCIALERGAAYYDLHNCFDFQGIEYDVAKRTVLMRWTRGTGDWVKASEPPELQLEFSGVSLFKAHERDAALPFTEDDCLDSLGFLWDNLLPEMHGYTSNQPAKDCTHFVAIFMSGFSVKVGAESVGLRVAGST